MVRKLNSAPLPASGSPLPSGSVGQSFTPRVARGERRKGSCAEAGLARGEAEADRSSGEGLHRQGPEEGGRGDGLILAPDASFMWSLLRIHRTLAAIGVPQSPAVFSRAFVDRVLRVFRL